MIRKPEDLPVCCFTKSSMVKKVKVKYKLCRGRFRTCPYKLKYKTHIFRIEGMGFFVFSER